MAVDILQKKIKKSSHPLLLDMTVTEKDLPPQIVQEFEGCLSDALFVYSSRLMLALKGEVSAVSFRLHQYILWGDPGASRLAELLKLASSLGFYTILDVSGVNTPEDAQYISEHIWGDESKLSCDGLSVSGYYGSDIWKPFLPFCEKSNKDLFVMIRSDSKSASEIQDLLAGSRMVHMAAADYVNRFGTKMVGKSGYSRIAIAVSCTSGDSIKMLRQKYPHLFMKIDGMDSPGGNAKNCSYGFDRLGYGAIITVGKTIVSAWKLDLDTQSDYVEKAVLEVHKIQNRISRYITVL